MREVFLNIMIAISVMLNFYLVWFNLDILDELEEKEKQIIDLANTIDELSTR